jgi:hypothetical protein
VRSGKNGLLLAAMQSPTVTLGSLELALVTAMYGCNADLSELLLMAGDFPVTPRDLTLAFFDIPSSRR